MEASVRNKNTFNPEAVGVKKFISQAKSWKLNLYFWAKLPTALYWGIKVKSLTPYKSVVTIPYKRRTQNPFKSIYFAAQSGAGEFCTGALCKIALEERGSISMLVTDFQAKFVKKASTLTTFTCEDGQAIIDTVQRAIDTGEGQEVKATATGRDESGDIVSYIYVTWSFKVRTPKK